MPPFFRNKRLIILLISFIILVVLIGFTIQENRNILLPEQFTRDTVGFVQRIFKVPTQFVTDVVHDIRDLRNLSEENRRLKEQLDDFLALSQQVTMLERDNQELRDLVGISDDELLSSYRSIKAAVNHRNPNQWNSTISINKGELDGVGVNMAVITADGLIGRVRSVSQFTATVQLLTDASSINRTSAAVQGQEKIHGFIGGYDDNNEFLLFRSIPSEAKIEEGQIVVTSGLSDIFPSNVVIGTVKKVEMDGSGLTQTAFVDPAANFYNINHVIVLDRLVGSGVEGGE